MTLFNGPSSVVFDFFYDETNNIRKLYLTDSKENFLNSEQNPFILGGLATPQNLQNDENFKSSIDELFKKLGIQKTQKEVKFKHIAHGNFDSILKSKKLNIILDWILKENLVFHFMLLDVIHWSLIDIIESDITLKLCDENSDIDLGVKGLLTEIVKKYKKDFFKDLFEMGYPNVDGKKDVLVSILKKYFDNFKKDKKYNTINPIITEKLEIIIENFNYDDDYFCFLENEKENKLIDNFTTFYTTRIQHFPKSMHYLDEELSIMNSIKELQEFPEFDFDNFMFLQSNDNSLIQLSDIMIGFFREIIIFLEKVNVVNSYTVRNIYNSLNEKQKELLYKFFCIYQNSIHQDEYMAHYISSPFLIAKLEMFKYYCLNYSNKGA